MANYRLGYTNALLLDAQNKALILRRSSTHRRHAFEADLPGGLLDENETHEQAIVREIQEETGILVEPTDLIEVYRGKGLYGWQEQTVFIIHLVDTGPEVTLSSEHDQFEWVALDQLAHIPGSIQNKIEKIIQSKILES